MYIFEYGLYKGKVCADAARHKNSVYLIVYMMNKKNKCYETVYVSWHDLPFGSPEYKNTVFQRSFKIYNKRDYLLIDALEVITKKYKTENGALKELMLFELERYTNNYSHVFDK